MGDQSSSWTTHWRSHPTFIQATVAVCLFTDLFLYSLVVPVIPFLLRDRFSVPEDRIQPYTSGLLAAYAGASVLFSIPSGWAADRIHSRKAVILVGSLLLIVGTAIFAFGQSFTVLLIARTLQGMAAAVISTAGLAMIQDSVGSAKLGQALGIVFSISTIGELVGPGLGGMLYDAAGIHAVYGVAVGFIAVDLIMRLLAVDSKTAATTRNNISHSDGRSDQENVETRLGTGEVEPCEDSPLLHKSNDNNDYKINAKLGGFVQAVPVLYCFRDPRLVMAQFLGIVQGSILGLFEATVPTEAAALFQFSSFKAGLLFTTITIPYIFLGPLAGRAVDRYGTKLVATTGYVFLIPCLAILGLPSQKLITGTGNIVLFCAILLLNGAGLSAIGSPSFVEAIDVTGNYEAANPGFFGEKGPYAQMFGFNFVFFFSGLTIGPLLGGALRNAFGYAVMGYVFAALSTITAILSYFFVGPRGTREE